MTLVAFNEQRPSSPTICYRVRRRPFSVVSCKNECRPDGRARYVGPTTWLHGICTDDNSYYEVRFFLTAFTRARKMGRNSENVSTMCVAKKEKETTKKTIFWRFTTLINAHKRDMPNSCRTLWLFGNRHANVSGKSPNSSLVQCNARAQRRRACTDVLV